MVKQNTPEWLEMRKKMVGASDAPIIMQVSPYGTPYQLWEQKLDLAPPKEDTFAMREGRRKEDPARLELEKMTGLFFLPQVKFHRQFPWMMASLDCIDPEGKYIAEIKCPKEEDHAIALAGQVPDKYFPQVQHQLEVCELEMGYYFSFYKTAGVIVKVYRDDHYIKKMLEKEKEFWDRLQEFTPPPMTEKDYEQKTDEKWLYTCEELLKIREQLKEIEVLEKREKQLEDELKILSNKRNCIGGGVKLTRFIRKGNVDYSCIPELKNVELESYRKPPIEAYRISVI